jgi:hypothetical protein
MEPADHGPQQRIVALLVLNNHAYEQVHDRIIQALRKLETIRDIGCFGSLMSCQGADKPLRDWRRIPFHKRVEPRICR